MFALTPTSAVFQSCLHSCRRSRAAEKRSCQRNTCVWGLWSSIPLSLPSSAILRSEISGSWDLMMRKGGAQKMLNEYQCTVLNNLVPRVRFPFGQHQEHGLWPDPKQEVRESRTSDSSTQIQSEI